MSESARVPAMTITMYTMAVDSFAPMLASLSAILDKAAAHAADTSADLANARLAPDMFSLAQQVQSACHHAQDGVGRLTGRPPSQPEPVGATLDDLKKRIAETVAYLNSVDPAAFAGAEARDCGIEIPGTIVIDMNGLQFLRAWALPHFYFHLVTAYGILRSQGVTIGKQDYLSQVAAFIRPAA